MTNRVKNTETDLAGNLAGVLTGKQKSSKVGFAIVLILIVAGIIAFGLFNVFGLPEGTVRITNTFIDVNGDGLVDLVKIADVILNTGSNITFP